MVDAKASISDFQQLDKSPIMESLNEETPARYPNGLDEEVKK